MSKTSLQNRVRKGCNCKKSNCKKKYCECFSANLTCTDICKCEHCFNKKGGEEQAKVEFREEPLQELKRKSKKIKKEDSE